MKNIKSIASVVVIAVAATMMVTGCGGDNNKATTTVATEAVEEVSFDDFEVVDPTEDATTGQKNALRAVESYIEFMPFSKTGLMEQLEYEGYPTEDIQFAIDNCYVDFSVQAFLTAQGYLEFAAFSREELIAQLEFDGFTAEQAEFGVTAAGY